MGHAVGTRARGGTVGWPAPRSAVEETHLNKSTLTCAHPDHSTGPRRTASEGKRQDPVGADSGDIGLKNESKSATPTAGLASKALGRAAHRAAATLDQELAAIHAELEGLLPRCAPDSEMARGILEARSALARAQQVTDRLRALGRGRERAPKLLSLTRALAEVRSLLEGIVPPEIEFNIVPLPATYARLDAEDLEQLFVHLVTNAVDASAAGGQVTLRAGSAVVDPASYDDSWVWHPRRPPAGRYACIDVEDTGAGMPPHVRDAAFAPFYTTRQQRAGIGLDVVLGTVHETGGYVGVQTVVGEGTTVQLMMPAAASSYSELAAIRTPGSALRNVLVAAPEPTIRAFITGALERSGFDVLSESDGPSALARVKRDQPDLDLLIVDSELRGLGGLDLADAMCARFPGLPVLYLVEKGAARAPGEPRASPRHSLEKPFRVPELLDAVRCAVSDTRTSRTPVIGGGSS